MYTTEAQLTPLLPPQFLVEALDDDRDGAADANLLDAIIDAAGVEIDAALGQRYPVPFSAPFPALVSHSAKVLVLNTLYMRRGVSEKNNPWHAQAEAVRKHLKAVGKGDAPLTPETKKTRPPVSIITEPSRMHSSAGRIIT
ncbi:MAG: DUF1320 family protein [Kiritimatiellae bacterium]|nr:DUF1320 family protein [Kiritimatiellia bacterium]